MDGIVRSAQTETGPSAQQWVCSAVQKIQSDFNRSADTHLIRIDLPKFPTITLYLKDESTHPSGSLKHRLARSLFLYGICNGLIGEETPIIESSSGSTAISEAYFARLLGLKFIAVVPENTAKQKLEQIRFYGGEIHQVQAADIYDAAEKLASELNGHYMDQFKYAERATDWRGNNNIAQRLFSQLSSEDNPIPKWVVMSAGTGGTSSTIGRYIRYHPELMGKTQLCVVDPENSVFFDAFTSNNKNVFASTTSRIEGIGRPRCEASFIPGVIDRMLKIPDAASIATIHWLESILGRRCGGSTGTNVYGAISLMAEMRNMGQTGNVATLICDGGERYGDSYYNYDWIKNEGLELNAHLEYLRHQTGT